MAKRHCTNIEIAHPVITLCIPNFITIKSTNTSILNWKFIPNTDRKSHIFQHLKSGAVTPIYFLCNPICNTLFTKYSVYIFRHDILILERFCNIPTGLRRVILNLHSNFFHQYTSINMSELITKWEIELFLHAACGSPVPSTWIKSINYGIFAI